LAILAILAILARVILLFEPAGGRELPRTTPEKRGQLLSKIAAKRRKEKEISLAKIAKIAK
jgi:hypothetical protein